MALQQPAVDSFRFLASHWATGVSVVTTCDDHGRVFGLTMSAVTTLSLQPMQYLICIDERSTALAALLQSGQFGINYLAADQAELSQRFASKAADKFAAVPYRRLNSGVPMLDGVIGFVECKVNTALSGGDHKIVIGDVQRLIVPGGDPLVHFRGEYRRLL